MGNGIQPQQWFYGGEPPTWNGLWSKNTGGKFGMPPLISNINQYHVSIDIYWLLIVSDQ